MFCNRFPELSNKRYLHYSALFLDIIYMSFVFVYVAVPGENPRPVASH